MDASQQEAVRRSLRTPRLRGPLVRRDIAESLDESHRSPTRRTYAGKEGGGREGAAREELRDLPLPEKIIGRHKETRAGQDPPQQSPPTYPKDDEKDANQETGLEMKPDNAQGEVSTLRQLLVSQAGGRGSDLTIS